MQPFKTTAKSVFNCYVCCSLWLSLLAGVQCGSSASSSNRPGPLKFLFVPLLGNSPAIDMMGVAAELRSRGHAVAVVAVPAALPFMRQAVARYSDDATAELVEYIAADLGMPAREAAPEQMKDAQRTSKPYQQRFTVPQSRLRFLTVGLQLLLTIQDNAAGPCSKVLADPALLQRLRSFAPHAVLALGLPVASGAASDSCGCLLSHALGAPLIDLMGVVWTGPSSTPQFGSGEAGLPHGLKLADLPLADNTKVVDWVDYNDVLGHPATRLLVSHCGLHSIYEAAFHGVPVVGLPFMFEQADNCMKLAARGAAVLSQQAPAFRCYNDSGASSSSYSSQHLVQLIKQVLHTPGYAAAARRLSA
ncbi:hypothetical protein OEZ86_013054 [Tetradesmus obliquus]|nr:hypothetical protein OEZ86_013054 [Tetradesmus obliquus]